MAIKIDGRPNYIYHHVTWEYTWCKCNELESLNSVGNLELRIELNVANSDAQTQL